MKPVQICCCSKYYTQTMCTILKCFFILVDVTNPFSQESQLKDHSPVCLPNMCTRRELLCVNILPHYGQGYLGEH